MERWFRIYCVILSYLFLNLVDSTVLLYDTDNREKTQAYDCIYYYDSGINIYANIEEKQSIKYCIRSNEFVSIDRNYNRGCSNEGVLVTFERLKQLNISIEELLKWNSGVNVVDRYQSYLKNDYLKFNETTENFICNCTKSGTFGIFCEYQFSNNTFEDTIQYQLGLKTEYQIGSQLFGNTTCYKTSFPCERGMRCLDWRDICDGKPQCVNGTDEEYCEHLLLNECNSDTEYRCRNGMCIDEEYFLDGDIDCQDGTDEQLVLNIFTIAGSPILPNFNRDENKSPDKGMFSCGDGYFISEHHLLPRGSSYTDSCSSFREKQWMCELSDIRIMWTNPQNGHCLDFVDQTIDIEEEEDNCTFIIKCSFIRQGQHYLCPCTGNDCYSFRSDYCSKDQDFRFQYPIGPIFAPFVINIFKLHSHDYDLSRHPDWVVSTQNIKCNHGFSTVADALLLGSYNDVLGLTNLLSKLPFEFIVCNYDKMLYDKTSNNGSCWNDSYPNQAIYCPPYLLFECISKYQVNDGISDCTSGYDELNLNWFSNCSSIQKHRFQCSKDEPTCFTMWKIGNDIDDCKTNNRDEYSLEDGVYLKNIKCVSKNSDHCKYLRQYIMQSSQAITSTTSTSSHSTSVENAGEEIKFWSYCNTIWNKNYGEDETNCLEWKCPLNKHYYQCQTGQCIPADWLCNGYWDCSDASDEEGFQLLTDHTVGKHNLKLFQSLNWNLADKKTKCLTANNRSSFVNLCNRSYEYTCILANVEDPWNFMLNRPCINLTKLGDGHIDCYGGLDERNLLNCSSVEQLDFSFKCHHSDKCIRPSLQCTPNFRCSHGEDSLLCFHLRNNTYVTCDGTAGDGRIIDDVWCLNGECKNNSRCNGKLECPSGEDEFFCPTGSDPDNIDFYRRTLHIRLDIQGIYIELPNYPSLSFSTEDQQNAHNEITQTPTEYKQHYYPPSLREEQQLAQIYSKEGWICNRGILAWKKSFDNNQQDVQCFCPPSYYGEWCQWMSDRFTVFTHFQGHTDRISKGVIKILAVFIVTINDTTTVLDHHEYHFTSTLENFDEKHKFYFVYPRPHQLRSTTNNYAIRFEAYLLNNDETIEFLAVWIYSIPFNFLPSQRLAKVLKYNQPSKLNINHTCLSINNPCLNEGKCHPLMNKFNDTQSYWCECRNDSYGSHCQFKDQSCFMNSRNRTSCSQTSLCRPKYDENGEKPLCICSMSSYGSGCYLERQCQMNKGQNPCLNGGICFVKYEHDSLIDAYICQCPNNYYGSKCEQRSSTIEMIYDHQNQSFYLSNNNIVATVIQLFDFNTKEDLLLQKQTVCKANLPLHSKIVYDSITLPIFGLIKLYRNKSTIDYHLLYSTSINEPSFNLTIMFNKQSYCPHTSEIFQQYNITYSKSKIVTKYHTLCNENVNRSLDLLCFRDDDYFCLCDIYNVTQCLLYNQSLDQCEHCLHEGKCIGDPKESGSYLCLCPRCYYGPKCQLSAQALSFTLESLFIADLFSSSLIGQKVSFIMYILVPVLLFVYGIINNLFSFVTFRRPKPRLNGTGYYLLISSIISQLSVSFLISKIIYILIGTKGDIAQTLFNLILCKCLSFFLSSCTRIYYWLTAFVTIERLYVTKYPTKIWLKQPKIAKIIIIIIFIITFASHVHELIEYIIVNDSNYVVNGTWCVTNYSEPLRVYNQINTFIHYLIPFLINFICTIYLTILIVRSRANVDKKKTRSQLLYEHLKKKKEIFVPPIMIILSALPQLIMSFSLACTELDIKWERYLLIIAYFFSYIPQILTFHLYVQPSTFFSAEFYSTNIGSTLKRRLNIKPSQKQNIKSKK